MPSCGHSCICYRLRFLTGLEKTLQITDVQPAVAKILEARQASAPPSMSSFPWENLPTQMPDPKTQENLGLKSVRPRFETIEGRKICCDFGNSCGSESILAILRTLAQHVKKGQAEMASEMPGDMGAQPDERDAGVSDEIWAELQRAKEATWKSWEPATDLRANLHEVIYLRLSLTFFGGLRYIPSIFHDLRPLHKRKRELLLSSSGLRTDAS